MYNSEEIVDTVYESKFIRPGIIENVVIGGIQAITSPNGKPYVEVLFYKDTATPEDGAKIRFYMTDATVKYSIKKLKHLATKVVSTEDFDAADKTAKTHEQFGENINKLLKGKTIRRMKFTGEEYVGTDGNVKLRSSIGLPGFAEGADVTKSKLVFDETNQYDVKRLPKATTESNIGNGQGAESDLPF